MVRLWKGKAEQRSAVKSGKSELVQEITRVCVERFREGRWEWLEGKSGGEAVSRKQQSRNLSSYSEEAGMELD